MAKKSLVPFGKSSEENGSTRDQGVLEKVIETDHPNKKKYPNQKILIVDVEGYAYLVPCVIEKMNTFLKR